MIDYRHYLHNAVEGTAEPIQRCLGADKLRIDLEAEFRDTLSARMESQENVERYAARCPVEGTVPQEYHLREITLFDDLSVLAGIHFRNLDTSFPFVGVFAQSRFLDPDEVLTASRRLGEEFRIFRPHWVQWWCGANRFDMRGIPGAVGDQRLIVGDISEILATPPPALPTTSEQYLLELLPETERAGYERYSNAFTEFMAQNPQWHNRLHMTTPDEFKECEEAGGLFALTAGTNAQHYCGVIAAMPSQLKGIRGWLMMEELITESFRGKGLAPVMQRLFIEKLDREKGQLIFGTIDDKNTPSLRTALRVGRYDAGGWVFVPTLLD